MKTLIGNCYNDVLGILSAFGMALADVVHEEQEPAALKLETQGHSSFKEIDVLMVERGRGLLISL